MSNAKHTPGPWYIVDAVNGDWPTGCELCIDNVEGGNPETDYCIASAVHGDPDTLLANARLISAAPELLEALKTAQALLFMRTEPDDKEAMQAISKCMSAIAKARGE